MRLSRLSYPLTFHFLSYLPLSNILNLFSTPFHILAKSHRLICIPSENVFCHGCQMSASQLTVEEPDVFENQFGVKPSISVVVTRVVSVDLANQHSHFVC